MQTGQVRSEIFGKDDKPTIYYLTGYGMTIRQVRLHARVLAWFGFRVVVFEYDRSVLVGGEPQLLVDAIRSVVDTVKQDMKSHRTAGVYGISLGTMFAYDVLKIDGIDKAIMSAGGCPLLRAVWDVPADGPARRNFRKNNYDRAAVEKVWMGYDVTPTKNDIKGKRLLLLISKSDRVIPYDFVRENIDMWELGSGVLEVVSVKRLGHVAVIIRNMLRISRTARFYRQEGVY